jgi:Arc/MetJ-type ribon-helix-helix transcriptional regulator
VHEPTPHVVQNVLQETQAMSRSIHVRLDDTAEDALSMLRSSGLSDSEAVRIALRESAARRRTASALRAEVARLAEDPRDREEMRAIREFMEELAPHVPEE